MVENPLSKLGWFGAGIFGAFVLIANGFFNSLGSDLYDQVKIMTSEFPFDFVMFFAICIAIGIITGIGLIVFDIYEQKHKKKLPKGSFHPTFSGIETGPNKIDKEELKRRNEDKWRFFPSNYK
jgi:hypothetical protein